MENIKICDVTATANKGIQQACKAGGRLYVPRQQGEQAEDRAGGRIAAGRRPERTGRASPQTRKKQPACFLIRSVKRQRDKTKGGNNNGRENYYHTGRVEEIPHPSSPQSRQRQRETLSFLRNEVDSLEATWEGAAQNQFFISYAEMEQTLNQFPEVLDGISQQLTTVAQTLEDTDEQLGASLA